MNTHYLSFKTKVGWITLFGNTETITKISFNNSSQPNLKQANDLQNFKLAKNEIIKYLSGDLSKFSFKTKLNASPFQTKVLKALQKIKPGKTLSYGEIAEQIGSPGAARAVGLANRNNPLPLVYPCHRVIGKNGKLTGFNGGIDIKQQLLTLEGANFEPELPINF